MLFTGRAHGIVRWHAGCEIVGTMKLEDRTNRDRAKAAGITMIEYIVLVTMVVLGLVAAQIFLPSDESFGILGNSFVVWFQKFEAVMSLPFP